jgi:GTPase SAR1 family protein
MKTEYAEFKDRILALFTDLHALTVETGAGNLREVAASLIQNVSAPFLFVVVGEVKSGKSSFINALLGEEVCAVAPDPCTDTIQKIVHAPEPYTKETGEHVREVGLDRDILREIAIVDTPGTNSILARHQEITEGFIPESDLVIFVFPAANPYTLTAWEFFNFVKDEWRKKIIFVLQQRDRVSEEELAVSRERVAQYAAERGIDDPRIFAVSAKARLAAEDGGFEDVWDYIRSTVTGGLHYRYKMESLLGTAGHVLEVIDSGLDEERAALEQDVAECERIRAALDRGRETGLRDLKVLQTSLVQTYSALADEVVAEFEQGLSLPSLVRSSFSGVVGRKNALKEWVEKLGDSFTERFTARADGITRESARSIAEHTISVVQSILAELKGRREVRSPDDATITVLAQKRLAVIDEVVGNVTRLLAGEEFGERLRPADLRKIGDRTVMGGFITAVGAVLVASTHIALFDVTGGVITALGALVAINTLFFQRRTAVRRFREGFEKGREQFEHELKERLAGRVETIYEELETAFVPLFTDVEHRSRRVDELGGSVDRLASGIRTETERITGLVEAEAES